MMIERERGNIVGLPSKPDGEPDAAHDDLPFYVELWHSDGERVERVLARALGVQLARAIFQAAQNEFPDRRITLRRGRELLLDSAVSAKPES